MSSKERFSPIRKGLLELLILKIVAARKVYAADILKRLSTTEFATREGTLYPLLSRMRREGLVDYEWKESDAGPPRKYYELTLRGEEPEIHALARAESDGPTRSMKEEKRLLYVALTRARRRLVLCASGTADADSDRAEPRTTFLRILSEGLRALFQRAQSSPANELSWTPAYHAHRIRIVCPRPEPAHCRSDREERGRRMVDMEDLPPVVRKNKDRGLSRERWWQSTLDARQRRTSVSMELGTSNYWRNESASRIPRSSGAVESVIVVKAT